MAVAYLSIERFGFIIIFALLYLGLLDPVFNVFYRLFLAIIS